MRFDDTQEFNDGFLPSGDEITHDVLEDSDDLLYQLSSELGIPDFLEDGGGYSGLQDPEIQSCTSPPSPNPQELTHLGGIESGLLDNSMMDMSDSLFPDIPSSDSAYSGSIKSEPSSPLCVLPPSPSHCHTLPPSPTSSEYSTSPSPQHVTLPPSPNPTLPPLPTPTQSTTQTLVLSPDGSMRLLSPSVPAKVAIPKIRKPPPAAPSPAPLVLQLGPDGNYYTKTSLTMPLSSMVVKAETVSGIQSPASYCSPMVAGLPTVTSNSGEDVRNMKRQQRMIKNRESACISRKKKKEYVTSLEEHIKKLTDDNNHLRTENESLKAKVQELQNEKNLWTSSLLTSSSVRKAGAVFALLVVVSLNVVSLQEGSRQTWPLGDRSHHIKTGGRTLMMTDLDYPDTETESPGQDQDRHKQGAEIGVNYTVSNSPMCTVFQNQSESIRLESELRGWFRVEPTPSPTTPPRRRPDSTSFPSEKKERVSSSSSSTASSSSSSSGSVGRVIRSPLTGSVYHMLVQGPSPSPSRALGLYDSPHNPTHSFASFFDAIERRDDTFYVVSFSGDHILVPATNHSQENRPRMSLLLPALQASLNESQRPPPGSIAMMKIDCEVMNTQLLHVHPDAVPVHMAENLRHGNISGDGKNKKEEEEEEREGKKGSSTSSNSIYSNNYRTSQRRNMEQGEQDNVTMDGDSVLDNVLPSLERQFETALKTKYNRRKRKAAPGHH